jgi:cytochrome c biogenesis protein CcmG, thiol:disulfide interchange protein DsbE
VPSPRAKLALLGLIPLGLLALIFVAAQLRPSDDPGVVLELSRPMPDLGDRWLTGEGLPAGALQDKVVVVNFWGSWCGPCRREQPVLQRLSEEYEGQVQFVGVDFIDDEAAAREFVREFGVTYPSVVDEGSLAHEFGVPYAPATFLVDRSGVMRYQLLGAQEEDELRAYLEELL